MLKDKIWFGMSIQTKKQKQKIKINKSKFKMQTVLSNPLNLFEFVVITTNAIHLKSKSCDLLSRIGAFETCLWLFTTGSLK